MNVCGLWQNMYQKHGFLPNCRKHATNLGKSLSDKK